MKKSFRILSIVFVLGLASLLVPARDRSEKPGPVAVAGTVLDAGSMAPLPGVEVKWRSTRATSDQAGHYQIEVPAGVREISFLAPGRPPVKKTLIMREGGARVRQDALLPGSIQAARQVLALDRGSRLGRHGDDLVSDVPADSTISLADEYGNGDQLLTLNVGKARVHSPLWLDAETIAFGKEVVFHRAGRSSLLGLFQYQSSTNQTAQIVSGIAAHFLARSPRNSALAIAGQKELYVLPSRSNPASLRRIVSLGRDEGFLLSIAWAADDRIYFTVDDSVKVDRQHSLSRSRIASVAPDGTGLNPRWQSAPGYSYRYPVAGDGTEILFCRFLIDGRQQSLWSRDTGTGKTRPVLAPALRAVHMNPGAGRLYYIYGQELHLRDLKSGADWVLLNSVKEADYLD